MKHITKTLLALTLFLSTTAVRAQHREVAMQSSALMGIMYGPMYDMHPSIKWGKSMEKVYRFRLDRTYLNASMYQEQLYVTFSSGFFFGREKRYQISDKFYFLTAPEVGMYYATSNNYKQVSPSLRYNFGALYKINDNFLFSIEAPLSLNMYMYQNQGVWQSTSYHMNLLGESPQMTLSYAFKKKKKK